MNKIKTQNAFNNMFSYAKRLVIVNFEKVFAQN